MLHQLDAIAALIGAVKWVRVIQAINTNQGLGSERGEVGTNLLIGCQPGLARRRGWHTGGDKKCGIRASYVGVAPCLPSSLEPIFNAAVGRACRESECPAPGAPRRLG
jgi:hypothetical protein